MPLHMLLSKNKLSPTSTENSRNSSNQMKEILRSHDEKDIRIWDCGSPLYDSHELVAVSHIVERHFMVLPYLSGSRKVATELRRPQPPEKPAAAPSSAGKSSVLSFLNVWKRKMDGDRKREAKRQKTGISKIFECTRISPWKK